ncbi:MAG: chorismate mutase [Candidatus Riflebacteria bacterium]|nr:chorismate mutase [Candidatus Riflebacteria bacterium]
MIKSEINNLRAEIDQIDETISKLLSKRVDCAVKIGALKDKLRSSEEKGKISAYDPVRENEIIERLNKRVPTVPFNGIEIIFRQIISLCRNSAHKSTICVFGEISEFNYKQHFGYFSQYVICSNISSFAAELNKNKFNIGVVIGNIEGSNIQEIDKNNFKLIDTLENEGKAIRVYAQNL